MAQWALKKSYIEERELKKRKIQQFCLQSFKKYEKTGFNLKVVLLNTCCDKIYIYALKYCI